MTDGAARLGDILVEQGALARLALYGGIAHNRPGGTLAHLHTLAARIEVLGRTGRVEEATGQAVRLARFLRELDAAGAIDREALLADAALGPCWSTPEGATLRAEWGR